MIRCPLFLLLCFAFLACRSAPVTPTPITSTAEDGIRLAADLQVKVTTGLNEAQVTQLLGAPSAKNPLEDGRSQWIWAWSRATATETGVVTRLETESFSVYMKAGVVDETAFDRQVPIP